jgi:magnesium chelatase family protein
LKNKRGLMIHRPFRAPHHTISDTALVGGGTIPRPGEISLAHNGLLFLDELPEFKRAALEALRQPLEERNVTISRAKVTIQLYADRFHEPMPVRILHPWGKKMHLFTAGRTKIPGPNLGTTSWPDRPAVKSISRPFYELDCEKTSDTSAVIRSRVVRARAVQQHRNTTDLGSTINANLTSKQIREHCSPEESSKKLLYKSMESLRLSARAYERILKVCRTIADLAGKVSQ